jgi:molecular chaperone DnaJ
MIRSIFSQVSGAESASISDILWGLRHAAQDRQRGSDLRYDMEIRLEELGVEKEIEIAKLETCDKCQGSSAGGGSRSIMSRLQRPWAGISSRGFFRFRKHVRAMRAEKLSKPCRQCHGEGAWKNWAT